METTPSHDGDRELYRAYCRFLAVTGRGALDCLPPHGALRSWFVQHNQPVSFDQFLMGLRNLPPEQREEYVHLITEGLDVRDLMGTLLSEICTLRDRSKLAVGGPAPNGTQQR